ncbi:NAD(P)-dependent dehydrogenase, short-chain alcohol dehydrogenase family [Streptosporangium subroseum]|uniref:NAD(P)-dependent dehydrogenase, short-chain alcohol dehydrogenase family n=2 Tax=Streptosporangium subroseum TaxID=106412 RepID=A0A239NTD2_9ACTN|nr:NAD(P)-dependent dehydrogenase, short-chain alcohol dehydrogenase family [Streptosporangium subroseum]
MRQRTRMTERWTADKIGDLRGRTAVITGANTGIGFETAKVLAERGATVVLACRDTAKAEAAAVRIGGAVTTLRLDLASLTSVRQAADDLRTRHPRLDLLINNAGIMIPPYGRTEDGFELQFGVNHLGHFALTGLLLDLLLEVPGSRIVTVSSNGHKRGDLHVDDLMWERRKYRRMAAYAQSKLANLLFTYELQRRLAATGARTIAVAAHPGGSRTDLMRHSPLHNRLGTNRLLAPVVSKLVQDARLSALTTLRAAIDPSARGGDYYGPDGWGEWTGFPVHVESTARSHDLDLQRWLWTESERLTRVTYPISEQTPAKEQA